MIPWQPGYHADGALPRWTDGPGAGGMWKESPDDFVVVENPLAEPTGEGEHQWFRIEKVGRTTLDVVDALARAAGVSPDAIGYAGMKDRYARTTQDFTVQLGKPITALEGYTILAASRTRKRLRVGQLAGNRFELRIRNGSASVAAERCAMLKASAMPNYYGVQRVGGEAPLQGEAILRGGGPRLNYNQLKFTLSAYQSVLFNRVLARRGRARLEGDLQVDGVPTGPMYGPTMDWPTGEAAELERAVLAEARLPDDAWHRFPKLTQGTRRALWVAVDPQVEVIDSDSFWVRFSLPAGSYATVLLEEIL